MNAENLDKLQTQIQEYLLTSKQELVFDKIVDNPPVGAERRLNVYHDGYRLRLIEVLEIDYPKCQVLMGEEIFDLASRSYIDAYPSRHFSVRYFGRDFAKFLSETAPYIKHPYLSEMANFEWDVMLSLDAADSSIVGLDALRDIPTDKWADLKFTFHPSVHMREYQWDTPKIWKLIDGEEPARDPVKNETPISWMFWRKGIESMFESMGPAQVCLYNGICNGLSFADICESFIGVVPENEIPQTVVGILQHWLEQGMIRAIVGEGFSLASQYKCPFPLWR